MGRILEYVIFFSNLSLLIGAQQYKDKSPSNYERVKQENFTLTIKQFFPNNQNELFSKKVGGGSLPSGFPGKRLHPAKAPSRTPQMLRSLGLQAYASRDPLTKTKRRNPPSPYWRNGFSNSMRKKSVPLYAKNPTFRQNYYRYSYPPNFLGEGSVSKEKNPKLSFSYNQSNSLSYKTHNADQDKKGSDQRYGYKNWRSPRLHHSADSPKVCDPCNSVPWVPMLKVPDSYRQHRTHVTELHPAPVPDFTFDYKAFASDTHNILLPPVPLVPPLEPIYDGTISSSFGLPIGNIPTGHGLLAPINHLANKFNRYGANSIDYSNSLKFFPTQSLLESIPFTELSPVPVVPIHNSVPFYHFDSSITNLVPPTTKTVDVSNVVLTISEGNPVKPDSDSGKLHNVAPQKLHKDLSSQSSSTVDFQSTHSPTEQYPPIQPSNALHSQNQNFGTLEIVKSIPLAEFTSSAHEPSTLLLPSANPPFQHQFFGGPQHPAKSESHVQKESTDLYPPNLNFLVPPPAKRAESDTSYNSSKNEVLPFMNPPKNTDLVFEESVKSSTVPRPLTSPSLSWLFSDHAVQSTTPKSSEPAKQFASDTQEIASIVNNELRPISPRPFQLSADSSKTKKIQIIIPYTTKGKNGFDNNALESVHREVIQPPVSASTHENKSSHDSADFAFPPIPGGVHRHPFEANRDKKVIDETHNYVTFKSENERKENHPEIDLSTNHKYLTEMQHIIASNIRDLLRDEIKKSESDQNYPLQKNIDNWTALEYSNHKTVGPKEPKEIVNQALAVTSIPGTSISHLLLPSKKIPNEYFVTTPLPVYDEPKSPVYNATNSTVDSKPFTAKPYATTNLYYPTWGLKESALKTEKSVTSNHDNHEKNYTEVSKGTANAWGRLNENLVLPEAKRTRNLEGTTVSGWTNGFFASSVTNEKVEIVTPVSPSTYKRNFTTNSFKRTTRQVHTTERSKPSGIKINRGSLLLNKVNSTKLEKVSNLTSSFNRKSVFRVANKARRKQTVTRVSKTNSVKTETSRPSSREVESPATLPSPVLRNVSSEQLPKLSQTDKSERSSINDVFPFRNKELPWESKLNISQPNFRNDRQRNSLIKQTNLLRPTTTLADSS